MKMYGILLWLRGKEKMKINTDKIFGKEFFNGGKEEPGVYKSYLFDDYYWMKEFKSYGFKYEQQKLNIIIQNQVKNTFSLFPRATIKFKIGKALNEKGGYIRKNATLLVYKLLNLKSNYGILLFTKSERK